ncbi:transposase family protein, partial [Pontibacter sp. E15-1]|uniref:transposase family protein n=1 Tax=Pontibacter sp. E15-1 TaxID=2919918 RepID=UPI001F4F2090
MPARAPGPLYQSLCLLSGQVLLLDATERPVPRSVEAERQRHEYSGKKGCHTNKNLLLADQRGRVLYLSPTVVGSMHDKALADEMELEFVPGQGLLLDLGFLGYEPEGALTCLPFKKPPKGELSEYEKHYNQMLASLRVQVEHVIASVKRLRTVKEKIRLHKDPVRDAVMLIACGMHNLRETHRNLS